MEPQTITSGILLLVGAKCWLIAVLTTPLLALTAEYWFEHWNEPRTRRAAYAQILMMLGLAWVGALTVGDGFWMMSLGLTAAYILILYLIFLKVRAHSN